MKIALVYFQLTTQAGGQQQVYSLARELARGGHEVVLYAAEINRDYYPELLEGITVKVVAPSRSFAPLLQFAGDGLLARVMKKRKLDRLYLDAAKRIAKAMDRDFDAVNCHEDFAYKTGYFYKMRNPKARIVWTMNNPPYMRFPKESALLKVANFVYVALKNVSERKYFRAVDVVAVLSIYEETWAKKCNLPVRIVWSGLEFEKFYAPVKARRRGMPLRAMAIGALTPPRRYEDLIEGVALASEKGYDVSASIICKDLWNESAYREFLINLVRERGVGSRVTMNFEGLKDKELREAYHASDALALTVDIPPPQGYGWGSVVFEAAAAGLPIVLSRRTGAAHVLRDDENALFVDPMRPDQIARQLVRLADDPDFYKKIAENGQGFTRENISWKRYADNMLALFRGS